MHIYFVPVGPEEIAVEIMSLREAQSHGYSQTPVKKGKLVTAGNSFVTSARNFPIIIATAGSHMAIAHVRHHSVEAITATVMTVIKRKAPNDRIEMCMQFGNPELESVFVKQVHRLRIWHMWTMLRLDGFPALVRARKGDRDPDNWSLVRIKRNA